MVKHTQTIRRLLLANCLSVFDHFKGLVLKGFKRDVIMILSNNYGEKTFYDYFMIIFYVCLCCTWVKVFKNELSKICERQPLKN